MNTLLKSLTAGLLAIAVISFGLVRPSDAQNPAPGPGPTPASNEYTQIDVNYRAAVDDLMYFAGGPATLSAAVTMCEPQESIAVDIEVESGSMTRGEATEALADAIRDALPEDTNTTVTVAGSTIIVQPTCMGDNLGTPDEPHDHPNDGDKVNGNMPGSSQFTSN